MAVVPMPIYFDETINIFIESVLAGCTIYTMLYPLHPTSEEQFYELQQRLEGSKAHYATYFVDWFSGQYRGDLREGPINDSYRRVPLREMDGPLGLFQKHSLCFAQIYFIKRHNHMYKVIGWLFGWFYRRRFKPDVMVFWDTSERISIPWKLYFEQGPFYVFFSAQRFYVNNHPDALLDVGVSMISQACNQYRGTTEECTLLLQNPDKETVNREWIEEHSTTSGMIISYHSCLTRQFLPNYNKDLFLDVIGHKMNATLLNGRQLAKLNLISHNLTPFSRKDVMPFRCKTSFGDANLEAELLKIIPDAIEYFDIQMTTVVKKSELKRFGLIAIMLPFHYSVWYTLLTCILSVLVLSAVTIGWKTNILPQILLSIWAPLTDNWHPLGAHSRLTAVIFLWSVLCLSLTAIYGGDMASSISVLSPPGYPMTLEEIGPNTITFVAWTTNKGKLIGLAHQLRKIIHMETKLNKGNSKASNEELDKWALVADNLDRTFCGPENVDLTPTRPDFPFLCKGLSLDKHYNKPLTFVGLPEHILALWIAFQRGTSGFWVSSKSTLEVLQIRRGTALLENFLSKLVEPIAARWFAAGLHEYWFQELDLRADAKIFVPAARLPATSNVFFTNVNEIKPMELASITSVGALFYFLCFLSCFTFLIENASSGNIKQRTNIAVHKAQKTLVKFVLKFSRCMQPSLVKVWSICSHIKATLHAWKC